MTNPKIPTPAICPRCGCWYQSGIQRCLDDGSALLQADNMVRLFGPEARAALRCPSHYLAGAREGNGVVLRLNADGLRPRNDFVLEMARSEAPMQRMQ